MIKGQNCVVGIELLGLKKVATEDEIIALEKQLGFNLPRMYRDIFSQIVHGAGNFWAGEDCFYKHLPLIQIWAKELLLEDEFPESLPNDAFVFFMHQGYQFNFFKLSEGDNPPVYSYLEGQTEREFIKTYEKFTDFFCAGVEYFNKHSPKSMMCKPMTQLQELINDLESLKLTHHHENEDPWFNCPKSGECTNDTLSEIRCNCGADKHNQKVSIVIEKLKALMQ